MSANNTDLIIGKKLRQLRNLHGISQDTLANESGITFQQIQKYEKGVNRISASRLYDFSKILKVDIKTFFDPVISGEKSGAFAANSLAEGESNSFEKEEVLNSKETMNLVREYYKITDSSKRKNILDLIKAMNDDS